MDITVVTNEQYVLSFTDSQSMWSYTHLNILTTQGQTSFSDSDDNSNTLIYIT